MNNRNLVKQTKVWNKAIDIKPALSFDLFLDQPITKQSSIQCGGFSLDHFIPYSFVMHYELWNLILILKNLNSQKTNRLPQERFIPDYIRLKYDFFITLRTFGNKNDYEDYLSLTNSLDDNIVSWDYDIFHNLIYDNTISLFKIAYNHGYSVWDNLNSNN